MTYEDTIEVEPEVYDLYVEGKYLDALKMQGNILRRRRGNCNIWTAEKDIGVALRIAEEGNILLDVPSSVYGERSIHANATWKAVDEVVKAINKL